MPPERADDAYVGEYYDNATSFDEATDVTASAGAPVVADAELATAATITGTVTGSDGQPLANVGVNAYRKSNDGSWSSIRGDTTDGGGHYSLKVPAGNYRISFDPSDGLHGSEYFENATSLEDAFITYMEESAPKAAPSAAAAESVAAAVAAPPAEPPTRLGLGIGRMLAYAQRSAAIREVLGELVLGDQGYLGLKRRLLRAAPRFVWESALAGVKGRAS